MKEILDNAFEFLESAEDNLIKNRFNASVSDFFKSIVTYCDYIIYRKIRNLPKNHNERFDLLKKYFPDLFKNTFELFKKYRDSYNLRLTKKRCFKYKKICS